MASAKMSVAKFIEMALECSVYASPNDFGLTYDELHDVGRLFGFGAGELDDVAAQEAVVRDDGDGRLRPRTYGVPIDWVAYDEPDYRDPKTFEFVYQTLHALKKSEGAAQAYIDRSVLIAKGEAANLKRHDLEVAIATMINNSHLDENDGVLTFTLGGAHMGLPSERRRLAAQWRLRPTPVENRPRIYEAVKDVIARRTDGRPSHAEPLDAFADALEGLGYGPFRLWWTQAVSELNRLQPGQTSVAVSVAAAALVEGALTFVVKRAQDLGLPVLGSKKFRDEKPDKWKITELVESAARGGDTAILDAATKARAEALITTRQRIHAGGMLVEYPAGVPDLRPDEARDAKATADAVVRRVLEWLAKHPAKQT